MDAETKNYEISYAITPDVSEEEVFGHAGKITGFIQDLHGVVGRISEPKKQRLSYPIAKHFSAYFGYTTFAIAPGRIGELREKVKSDPSILRAMIVEEIKRPAADARRFRPRREPSVVASGEPVSGFTPQAPLAEDQARIEELDKQLEEVLGKANPEA